MYHPFQLGEKRTGQSLTAVRDFRQKANHLCFVTNRSSRYRFRVDTGLEVCVLLTSDADRRRSQDVYRLQAANSSRIATYRLRFLALNIESRCVFPWVFLCLCKCGTFNTGIRFRYYSNLDVSVRCRY